MATPTTGPSSSSQHTGTARALSCVKVKFVGRDLVSSPLSLSLSLSLSLYCRTAWMCRSGNAQKVRPSLGRTESGPDTPNTDTGPLPFENGGIVLTFDPLFQERFRQHLFVVPLIETL